MSRTWNPTCARTWRALRYPLTVPSRRSPTDPQAGPASSCVPATAHESSHDQPAPCPAGLVVSARRGQPLPHTPRARRREGETQLPPGHSPPAPPTPTNPPRPRPLPPPRPPPPPPPPPPPAPAPPPPPPPPPPAPPPPPPPPP